MQFCSRLKKFNCLSKITTQNFFGGWCVCMCYLKNIFFKYAIKLSTEKAFLYQSDEAHLYIKIHF